MKIVRKMFTATTDEKIEQKRKDLKKRNRTRYIAAGGVALSGGTISTVVGDLAGEVKEKQTLMTGQAKLANEIVSRLNNTYITLNRKARLGKLTEREAECYRVLQDRYKEPNSALRNKMEAWEMAKKSKSVQSAAKKAGSSVKRATIGMLAVPVAVGTGVILSKAKKDRDRTELQIKRIKEKEEKEKSFSKLGDATRRVTKKLVKSGVKSGKKYINNFNKTDYDNVKKVADVVVPEDKKKKVENTKTKVREKVSKENLKKAKESGVIQKDPNGNWRIISMKSGEYWDPKYTSKENAESALAAYHANKH